MENVTYPDRTNDPLYGLQKQTPSYQTEFPNDIPYDPGATSSLFELNYIPSVSSPLFLFGVLLVVLGIVVMRHKIRWSTFWPFVFVSALGLTFFGPVRLPSFSPFNTSLGIVKFVGALLVIVSLVPATVQSLLLRFIQSKSFVAVMLYLISNLLSVFVLTNLTFFLQDFNILLTGLAFYYLGFVFYNTNEAKNGLRLFAFYLLGASLFIYIILLFPVLGSSIVSSLYPKYENIVFAFDFSRNRIFSVIDFEYFAPCVVFLYLLNISPRRSMYRRIALMIGVISLGAITLVNYRYRFLTFLTGFVLMVAYMKSYRTRIVRSILVVLVLGFAGYIGLSSFFYRGTIIDRLLLRDYYEDVVSIERRLVMYRQALQLFSEAPLLGVGTGNYKDNVQIVYSRFGGRTYEPFFKILQNVYAYPHNWFLTVMAENGIIGFLILLWLLGTFIEIDLSLLQKLRGDHLLVFATLSSVSWLYVFANFFTMMHVSLPMVIIFWAFRGMIERIHSDASAVLVTR